MVMGPVPLLGIHAERFDEGVAFQPPNLAFGWYLGDPLRTGNFGHVRALSSAGGKIYRKTGKFGPCEPSEVSRPW